MGNSLSSINGNFAALSAAVCELSSVPAADASVNVFDSPTIDLNWNASTRTLSADVSTTVRNASAFNVFDSPTIDLNWNASTRTLSADVSTTVRNASAFNVFDSPTIDLDWNASTRTLSADVSTTVKNASAFNVFDSPTIDLNWNASTRTLSAVTTAGVALSSVVDAKFIPKPASASAQQVLTYNGSTATWVASAAGGASVAKAWVNFNGSSSTIRSSYNVSSVTKNGTGDYTVNFATPMADVNYAVVISKNTIGSNGNYPYSMATPNEDSSGRTTAKCVIVTAGMNGGGGADFSDYTYVSTAIFGN
jgi:uncharacterized protein YdgA (DUF945 family)